MTAFSSGLKVLTMSAQETGRKGGKTGTGRRETHKSKRVQRPNRSSRGRHHKGEATARRGRLQPEFSSVTPTTHFFDKGQINTDVLGCEAASDSVTSLPKRIQQDQTAAPPPRGWWTDFFGRELLKTQLCLKTGEEEKRLLCNFRSDREGTAGSHAQSAWQFKRKLHI